MKVSVLINDSYIDKNKESLIYLRVFINGSYLKIPLDIYICPESFDKEKNQVTSGPQKSIYNLMIKNALGAASEIILRYQVNKKNLTKEIFIKEFRNPTVLSDFYLFMADQIKMRSELTESSRKQHRTCLAKLKEYRSNLLMNEIDENIIRGFENHLKGKLKNGSNTIHNNLKVMATYINRAIRLDLMKVSPFKFYKPKRTETKPVFLTEDELINLEELYKKNCLQGNLQNVLRWFLFSCYTGIRISDIRRVKYENTDKLLLRFKPLKTENINGKYVEIPLIKKAVQLMKDEQPNRIKGVLFECYADQVINRRLKDIALDAVIEKEISFHTARHTFATLFLKKCKNANGILILKEILGHSNIETTMVYSHVSAEDIKKLWKNFKIYNFYNYLLSFEKKE
jgi:integrase/recombinase XerD